METLQGIPCMQDLVCSASSPAATTCACGMYAQVDRPLNGWKVSFQDAEHPQFPLYCLALSTLTFAGRSNTPIAILARKVKCPIALFIFTPIVESLQMVFTTGSSRQCMIGFLGPTQRPQRITFAKFILIFAGRFR